jgi:hypothetical protein
MEEKDSCQKHYSSAQVLSFHDMRDLPTHYRILPIGRSLHISITLLDQHDNGQMWRPSRIVLDEVI